MFGSYRCQTHSPICTIHFHISFQSKHGHTDTCNSGTYRDHCICHCTFLSHSSAHSMICYTCTRGYPAHHRHKHHVGPDTWRHIDLSGICLPSNQHYTHTCHRHSSHVSSTLCHICSPPCSLDRASLRNMNNPLVLLVCTLQYPFSCCRNREVSTHRGIALSHSGDRSTIRHIHI